MANVLCCFVLIPTTLLLAILLLWQLLTKRDNNSLLPPGPPSMLIIGNLHQLNSHHPHISLHRLAQKYGPIIQLQLGQVPTVVISTAKLAKQLIKAHDLALCNRPLTDAVKVLFYGGNDIAFAPYGSYWREVRKLCTLELFSSKRVQLFCHVRQEEVARLVGRIGSFYPEPVDLSEKLGLYANDAIFKAAFGRVFSEGGDYDRHGFRDMLHEAQVLLGGFGVGDLFPSLEWINLITGTKQRLVKAFKRFDAFFDELIEERHVPNKATSSKEKDLFQMLLEIQRSGSSDLCLTMDNVKALLMDIFIGGTDTTFVTLDWGMTELIMNPRVLEKAQEEVRNAMGNREWVSDSDMANMNYLKAVTKEVFRLHPPAPLLLPRESTEEVEISGYKIPPKTRFFFNAWAIGRDPAAYVDPEEFKPERFLGSSVDYRGQHFELIPFGIGRRSCPALLLGEAGVMLALAQLLHSFDWGLPIGVEAKDLDMTEVFGINTYRAKHLIVVAKPRFS